MHGPYDGVNMTAYRIAAAAAAIGVATGTLRLWEQHGLMNPTRLASGQRLYDEVEIARGRHITELRAREKLSLAEIRTLVFGFETAPPSRDGQAPGQRVRRMRAARRLSLNALATELGVSVSTLSTFERTSRGVGVSLLRRLANYFRVTVTELTVDPEMQRSGVVRREEGQRIAALGEGVLIRALATGVKLMDCKEWTLASGARSDGAYTHDGEEFVYVLSGAFALTVAGLGTTVLAAGDSLYFESHREHAWVNEGAEACVILWINTPASF